MEENTFNNSEVINNAAPQSNYYAPQQSNLEAPMTIGQWVGTLLLCCIPCVNIILLIVWACSAENKSKKNWALAQIIISVVVIVIYVILIVALGASLQGAMEDIISYM